MHARGVPSRALPTDRVGISHVYYAVKTTPIAHRAFGCIGIGLATETWLVMKFPQHSKRELPRVSFPGYDATHMLISRWSRALSA